MIRILYSPLTLQRSKPSEQHSRGKYTIKEASSPSLTKIEDIGLSVKAWEEGETRKLDNIVLVFRSSEIWPPNFTLMVNRLDIYQGVGLPNMLEETK